MSRQRRLVSVIDPDRIRFTELLLLEGFPRLVMRLRGLIFQPNYEKEGVMEPLDGIRSTLVACLYRIKGAGLFVQSFKDYLLRGAGQDQDLKSLIQEITDDSAALAVKVEKLLKKINSRKLNQVVAENRRREERFSAEGEATVLVNSSTKKTYLLKNLSREGVGLVGSHALRAGDKVDVIVLSPFLKNSVYEGASVRWGNQVEENLWEGGVALKSAA